MAAASSIIAAAAVAVAAGSAYEQRRQAKSAAKDRKEAEEIGQAEQAAEQMNQRRQQLREERVRRAQIIQASEGTGVSGSSGEIGATSALGTSTAGNISTLSRQRNAAQGIGYQMQSAAQHDLKGQQAQAVGQVATSVFSMAVGAGAFQGTTPAPTQTPAAAGSGNFSTVEQPNPYNKNIFGTR